MYWKLILNIFIIIVIDVICGFSRNARSQTTIDLTFENDLLMQNGLGWPSQLKVVKGNEALMKLKIPLANQRSCAVTDPSGVQFDVKQAPNNRYQQWGDGCGIRIKNVTDGDEGRWRLTVSRANDSISGWIDLSVLEKTPAESAPPIALKDGEHAEVALSSLDNTYCVVAKPFAESSLIPGQCSVTLDRTTRAVQGNWQVFLGLPGRVSELQTKRHVTVQTERLDVGYLHDAAGKLHLYCNILHSDKEVTFCRFQRTSSSYGYNVVDGLSDGSYSYYGDGFAHKQCGITIEKPSATDYATWRCSVGVGVRVGNDTQQQTQTLMQALISVTQSSKSPQNERNEDTNRRIFVQKDSPFTITCNAEVSLRYCWFQHPNGTQYTPVRLTNEQQLFWYTGESLELGNCGITFAHSNDSDDGKWSCFLAPRDKTGIEIKQEVEVRVTGALAANLRDVPVTLGENATLYCHTSNGRRALSYCRFLSPQFVGMSLDSSVTTENAILNRFYFTPGRDINVGDCSLSITSVQEEDIGTWTCAGVVDKEILESRDTMRVFVDETRRVPRLQAGIIGAGVGLSVLVILLIGYVSHKRGWMQHLLGLRFRRNTTVSEDTLHYSASTQRISSAASGSISSASSSGSISRTAITNVSSGSSDGVTGVSA